MSTSAKRALSTDTANRLLRNIVSLLNSELEWDSSTPVMIAEKLRESGYTILDSNDIESAESHIQFEKDHHCEACDHTWTDTWSSLCDDECPECGVAIQAEPGSEQLVESSLIPGFFVHPETNQVFKTDTADDGFLCQVLTGTGFVRVFERDLYPDEHLFVVEHYTDESDLPADAQR
ncbi:hypothetical protein HNP46_000343 [Pseudomonas nitritireducens]|uniref:Uncharacterized protein n=1 Tax=Pseudomonas nitroreducens TaxID=46680 RepID=A0A7W7NZS6_PSENT|nr:hypothetical protein [Pseudomonas nitritireducens]MBB4861532.1 hypothetical protein [Pseudomonas nitritireducens]